MNPCQRQYLQKTSLPAACKGVTCKMPGGWYQKKTSVLVYPKCEPWNPNASCSPAWLPAITICRGQ